MDRRRPLIIVEGDADKRLFDGIFRLPTKVDFPHGTVEHNKNSVIAAVYKLAEMNAIAVAGIVDADYDRIKGTKHILPNLFYTDEHDMEMQIIMSEAFRRFMNNSIGRTKFNRFWSSKGAKGDWIDMSRELILRIAIAVGFYRMAAFDMNPNIRFPEIDSSICNLNLRVDIKRIMDELAANGLARNNLKNAHRNFVRSVSFALRNQVARGHDAASILAIALQDAFASKHGITGKDVEAQLRTGYGLQEFTHSKVYSDLGAWAQKTRISLNYRT